MKITNGNTLNDVVYSDANNIRFVNDYTHIPVDFNSNEYEIVISFFKKAMKDPKTAENFTQSIFQVAARSGISPTSIVETMKGQTGLTLSSSLAYYLNGIRSNSTLLGVQGLGTPNFYTGRSVII